MQVMFDQEAHNACVKFSEETAKLFPECGDMNNQNVSAIQENNPPQSTLADILHSDEND